MGKILVLAPTSTWSTTAQKLANSVSKILVTRTLPFGSVSGWLNDEKGSPHGVERAEVLSLARTGVSYVVS